MPVSPELAAALAPTGTLRASINVGNPILARLDGNGRAAGVSVDLAIQFAKRLGLALELKVFPSAGESVAAVSAGEADFGFFAIDPERAQQIAFTEAYVLIEGSYLVKEASPLMSNDQVDATGTRVVVGKGSAYDLYLSRSLANATVERCPTSPGVVDQFLASGADVAAGVRQQLMFDAQRHPGLRLLPGRFMVIQQAMGVPRKAGAAAIAELRAFVETAKAQGWVLEALNRHGISGATVAPLQPA
ncbi:transporter substrate-binding domain-containing protein [Pseudomonas sp. KNUC1026]|uniref:transporter substrate-binding domain-containing protein n=1 Tax=Pseudomonas sp. KNUC1026 TaxID=2893890 RepID=UPI001F1B68FD|nr:transporter substrate-binding domain-containing protein [Pseudomonas sp. KNUC1026]UFH50460.1 transporter substrate-binding domain-containing protein [Pseudomonas sp. KNUC1026]